LRISSTRRRLLDDPIVGPLKFMQAVGFVAKQGGRGPMTVANAGKQWIQLRLGDAELAGVTVHPENGDVYALSKQMIARSGQLMFRIEAFEQQLAALKRDLESWSSAHSESVSEVFLVLKGDHFVFLAVLKGKAYDSALEDALTELDLKVAQNPDYNLINLSVLALPAFAEDAIRSFLPHRPVPKDESGDAERG
jgi:hypothetical protein